MVRGTVGKSAGPRENTRQIYRKIYRKDLAELSKSLVVGLALHELSPHNVELPVGDTCDTELLGQSTGVRDAPVRVMGPATQQMRGSAHLCKMTPCSGPLVEIKGFEL